MIAGRVIMLSSDQGLAAIAGQLVGRGQPLTRFASPAEVPDWLRPPTGAVVLDFPRRVRRIVYWQLRQRYRGPVLALLAPDEDSSGLPTDHCRLGVLHRPFSGEDLSASLDALVGSAARNGAREPKSPSLTAPPVGTDQTFGAAALGAASPAALPAPPPPPLPAPAGPAAAIPGVAAPPAKAKAPAAGVVALAAIAALLVGITLSDGGRCRSPGCSNVVSADESSAVGAPLAGLIPTTPQPGGQPVTGSAKGTATKPASGTADQPSPSMVIPIASGAGTLPPTTQPPVTTSPVTRAPPATTEPPPTEPPTTAPPTTAPTTTEPPTTAPPTTEPPPTTDPTPATTAAAPAPSETVPPGGASPGV